MSGMGVAAKRYAKALFAVAQEKGLVEETKAQLDAVVDALTSSSDIQAFLEHPNIAASKKKEAIRTAISGKVNEYVLQTVQLLVDRGRAAAIGPVRDAYAAIADEALGRAVASVASAFELTAEQQQDIASKFSAITGKQVTVESVVDPSLLGGIRVRIGDTLYDGSLATKLAELERSFNHAR
ncbi:F0F1 ATP synthase subunit delta [Paenibacillus sp.]|uniref:F0F1 ATP synthase subunit delta n=1 Tax=Paenibacillus sp. TaxID=58172 RepID=UPI002D6FB4DD|nr:F0F1 ATP synthase subunit delta [Paenibacillus sp.]HZG87337.1 F0F1 ATP synthase subunit delta [Paenibacillus sp.]